MKDQCQRLIELLKEMGLEVAECELPRFAGGGYQVLLALEHTGGSVETTFHFRGPDGARALEYVDVNTVFESRRLKK